jgi:Rod binding domain-containing protein
MAPLAALAPAIPAALNVTNDVHAKARAAAEEFESVFLNTMLQPMFTAGKTENAFSGGAGGEVWRSLLTDEYAKSFSKAGGIGIADHVYRSLIAAQEGRSA